MSTEGFSVNAGELKDKIERFKYVIPNRPSNKIFGHMLLHQVERTLVLSGCDNTKYAYAVLGVEWISWKGTSVKMAVPYRQLIDFLKGVSEEDVLKCTQIYKRKSAPCLLIEYSGGEVIFQGIDASKYPPFPKVPNDAEIILGVDDIRRVFTKASYSTGMLDMFSPCGYTLSLCARQDLLLSEAKSVVVSEEALNAFLSSVRGLYSKYPASIYISSGRVGFSYAGFGLECSTLNSSYFVHQDAISSETLCPIIFERKLLCEAISRLLDFAGKENPQIDLILANDCATLSAQNKENDSGGVERVPCKHSGNTLKIRLDGKNLLLILEELYGWHIIMRVAGVDRPVIIEPERQILSRKVIGLIMPVAEGE